jgi:cytochrome c oxidase subunit 4
MNDHHSTSHGMDAHGEHGHHAHLGLYIYVFVALCVLTGASFFTYSDAWPFHHQPAVGWAFMMAVSCTKALLVIMFFMHVKYEKSWKYVLTIPTAMMAVFLVLMLIPDIGMRTHHYSEERLQNAATKPADHGTADAHGGAAKGKDAAGH